MRKRSILGSALIAITAAVGIGFVSLDSDIRALLLTGPTNADILSWSQPQRDAGFRALDRLPLLASASQIAASANPRALPNGRPLTIPGIDTYVASQHLAAMVVLQDGRIRYERYGLGFSAAGRWTSFSVAKSFTSTLVGAAIQDGSIRSLDDKVSAYIPDLRGSAYDDVSIRQLLTMSSGVRWDENYEDARSDVARFYAATADPGIDATVSYMRRLPRAHQPGTVWHYNTGETNLVGVLISSATHKPLSQYMQERIWGPAGMAAPATWLLGATGHEIAGCCIQAATRDFARFGQFVLEGGRSPSGQQIVPAGWFADATHSHIDIGQPGRGYGYFWWTYADGSYAAQGIFGQGIFIDPARHLVIATNGDWSRASQGPEGEARQAFYRQVQALIDAGG